MTQRIRTGILLALFAFIWLFFLPSAAFQLVVAIISFIVLNEWLNIHEVNLKHHLGAYIGLLLSIILQVSMPSLVTITACLVTIYYIFAFYRIYQFESHQLASDFEQDVSAMSAGILVISTLAAILITWQKDAALFHELVSLTSWYKLLFTATVIMVADISAYFAGKYLGRVKLVPQTSPKKTWIGAIAGILCAAIFALIFAYSLSLPAQSYVLSAIVIGVFSILGDIRISLVKRLHGAKDSGNILPGHGGILDRLDGWLAGFSIAYLLL